MKDNTIEDEANPSISRDKGHLNQGEYSPE
jgi:hypothetical protein